jgi:hypothetical protein
MAALPDAPEGKILSRSSTQTAQLLATIETIQANYERSTGTRSPAAPLNCGLGELSLGEPLHLNKSRHLRQLLLPSERTGSSMISLDIADACRLCH